MVLKLPSSINLKVALEKKIFISDLSVMQSHNTTARRLLLSAFSVPSAPFKQARRGPDAISSSRAAQVQRGHSNRPQICQPCMHVRMFRTCFPRTKWQFVACFARRRPQRAYYLFFPCRTWFGRKVGGSVSHSRETFST